MVLILSQWTFYLDEALDDDDEEVDKVSDEIIYATVNLDHAQRSRIMSEIQGTEQVDNARPHTITTNACAVNNDDEGTDYKYVCSETDLEPDNPPSGRPTSQPNPQPTPLPTSQDEEVCFAGSETLILENGQKITMDNVSICDRILVANNDDTFEFADGIALPHGKNQIETSFVELSTSASSLKATPAHLIMAGSFDLDSIWKNIIYKKLNGKLFNGICGLLYVIVLCNKTKNYDLFFLLFAFFFDLSISCFAWISSANIFFKQFTSSSVLTINSSFNLSAISLL